MILLSGFSVIGGLALGLSSRAAAFVLRMLVFAAMLSGAVTFSHGWGWAAFLGGFALACIGAQIGYLFVVLVRAAMVQPAIAGLKAGVKRAG